MDAELAQLTVAGLFLATGLGHATRPGSLVSALSAYRLISRRIAPIAAAAVVALELAVPIVLVLLGPEARALLLLLAAVAAFGAALMAIDLATGNRSHGCGCFGDLGGTMTWSMPFRSGIVAVSATWVAIVAPPLQFMPREVALVSFFAITAAWVFIISALSLRRAFHENSLGL
jgi:hypothetical protein